MNLEEGPFVFRVNDNGSGPTLLIQVCMERGWREYTETAPIRDNWNLWWKTSAFTVSQHKNLKAWQFTNHIPKRTSICRKDNLARNLKCMRKVYGSVYDISPLGYNLPLEYTKLVADCSRNTDEENQKVWICKPVGQSQGRGIFLFKSLSDLCYDSNAVVQRYIKNPLLIGGYKFDLRLYVCVPSYHPLTIYLYKEGLVRFSTDKFSLADLNNPFCHLTNSSLNKLGPGYAEQKDRVGSGCKWNFKQLRHYFQQAGIKDWLMWQKVSALVTLTILSQSTAVPQTTNCFEFYGFDVLIDDKLKPWLLEVNLSPALGNDCDVDPVVKKPLLHDLFDLLGLPVCNTGLSLFTIYNPYDSKLQPSSLSQSDTEECDTDRKQIALKSKSMGNRRVVNSKSDSASPLIVATAATKWRRRQKTSYLFGPPVRATESLDHDYVKRSGFVVQDLHRNKGMTKLENVKGCESSEAKSEEFLKTEPQNRKCVPQKRRERECSNNIRMACSVNYIRDVGKEKMEGQGCRVASSVENAKIIKRCQASSESNIGDSGPKKEKKISVPVASLKLQKKRLDTKSAVEKLKKFNQRESTTVKTVLLPFDRSQSAYKGFRGRTRHVPPVLWGNGRDWRRPIHKEGDWGRIYPLNANFNAKDLPEFEEDYMGNKFTVGDKQIRLVVDHVTRYVKISKQLYSSGLYNTEEELNAQLMKTLGLTGEVWLPSK